MIPGLGRSPGEGKVYPLQYSGLENSLDCIAYGVAKSRTQLGDFHFSLRDVSMSKFGPRRVGLVLAIEILLEMSVSLVIRFMSRTHTETSLVIQWLRFCTPKTGGLGLIPSQGPRSHLPQLRVLMLQLKKKKRSQMLQLRPGTFK